MRAKVNSAILAVLISIPIIIAKVKAEQPEANVRTPSPYEVDVMIAQNCTEAETPTIEEITRETVKVPEIVTEATTEAVFSGYDFIPIDEGLQVEIYSLCKKYEIAYELILSVIKTESNFQVDVVGDNGNSIGLMQIQPKWWQGLADTYGLNIYEPIDNVHLGILILNKALNDNGGDLDKALKQYNSGNPNYAGNEYINKVFSNYEWIEGELNVDR